MIEKIIVQMPIRSLLILSFASFFVDIYLFFDSKRREKYPNECLLSNYLGWIKSIKAYFTLMCLYVAFTQLFIVIILSYIGDIWGFKLIFPTKLKWFLIIVFSSGIALISRFKILMKGISKHIIDEGIPKQKPEPEKETEKISSLLALVYIIYGLFLGAMEDDKRKVVILSIGIGGLTLLLCSLPF